MRVVGLQAQLQNLSGFRFGVARRNLRIEQSPFCDLNGLIYKLRVFSLLDLVAIDNKCPAIGSNSFRRGRVSLLQHFRSNDVSFDLWPGSDPSAG